MNIIRYTAIISASLLLSGCMVGEDFERPEYKVDDSWDALREHNIENTNIAPIKASENRIVWWELLGDETLSTLITQALANNHDIKAAKARIKEARANEHQLTAELFPEITGSASKQRGTQGGSFGDSLETSRDYRIRGSWELDVFGGNRRRLEGAEYRVKQSEAEHDDIRRQLIADVARNYVRLRGLQQQYAIVLRNLELQRDTLAVTTAQREEGVVSQLDLLRSRAQANTTLSDLPSIKDGIHAAINRLTVLVASRPAKMKSKLAAPEPIPTIPRQVIVSLPVSIIAQRPDVKAAEWELAEATAISGATFAEFFPDISIDAFIGASNSSVFGKMTPWSIAGSVGQTLLDFGRIQSRVDAADARQEQAYHNFEQAVLRAVEDMEVSLSAYLNELERSDILRSVSNTQVQAVGIAKEQYFAGIAPQLDLLEAETNALNAERGMIVSQATAAENAILLLAALGENELTPPANYDNLPSVPVVVINDDIVEEAILEAEQQPNININQR